MICLPDGSMSPIIVEVTHPGVLSEKERDIILCREQIDGGVLISQHDTGLHSLSNINWKQVKRHIIYPAD